MKLKALIQPTLISIIPASLVLLNIFDLINVFNGKHDYPFGSEFSTPFSIYTSQNIYVGYSIIFTVVLILLICFNFFTQTEMVPFLFNPGDITVLVSHFNRKQLTKKL